MWMMAQLDKKEESERRRQEAAGAEDQQTTRAVAAISIAVGAAAAECSRGRGPADNIIVKVERRQQQAAGIEDRGGEFMERRLQEAAGTEDQQTAAKKNAEKNKRKRERKKAAKAAKAAEVAAVLAAGTTGPAADAVDASAAAAAQIGSGMMEAGGQGECDALVEAYCTDHIAENQKYTKPTESAEEAAVDPAEAGIAAADTAEAVAMEKAAERYRQRSVDVALGQLQWWTEEEAAEWAEEEARHMRADYI